MNFMIAERFFPVLNFRFGSRFHGWSHSPDDGGTPLRDRLGERNDECLRSCTLGSGTWSLSAGPCLLGSRALSPASFWGPRVGGDGEVGARPGVLRLEVPTGSLDRDRRPTHTGYLSRPCASTLP